MWTRSPSHISYCFWKKTWDKQKTKWAVLCSDRTKDVLRVGRVGRSQLLQVGYKERHLAKGISPIVENKETSCHSRIKSLGGLPEMKETRAEKRNKGSFASIQPSALNCPCSKGDSGIQKRSQAWGQKEQRLHKGNFYSPWFSDSSSAWKDSVDGLESLWKSYLFYLSHVPREKNCCPEWAGIWKYKDTELEKTTWATKFYPVPIYGGG